MIVVLIITVQELHLHYQIQVFKVVNTQQDRIDLSEGSSRNWLKGLDQNIYALCTVNSFIFQICTFDEVW